MSYKKIKKWRITNKQRMVAAFGGKCGICGYDKCITALEFHHLDKNEKELGLGRKVISWKRTCVELKKCVMLCANCHREIHHGTTLIPKNIKRFSEITIERNYDKDIMNNCPVCGEEKHYKAKTCSAKCGHKIRQKVDWDNVDLKKLLEVHKNYSKIGRILNISCNSVKKRAKKLSLI